MVEKISVKNKEIFKQNLKELLPIVGIYLVIFILFFVGIIIYDFPEKGVTGPGNEFTPIFRIFFLIFISLYPFIGIFSYLGYRTNEDSIQDLLNKIFNLQSNELLRFLVTFLFWPGLYLVIGYFIGIIDPIMDASVSNPPYWNIYWYMYFILGRIFDYGQLQRLEREKDLRAKNENMILRIFLLSIIDVLIFSLAGTIQFFVFFLAIFLLTVIALVASSTTFVILKTYGIIVLFITGLFIIFISATGYILMVILRGKIRKWFFLQKSKRTNNWEEIMYKIN